MSRWPRVVCAGILGAGLGLAPCGLPAAPARPTPTPLRHVHAWLTIPRLGLTLLPVVVRPLRVLPDGCLGPPRLPANAVVRLAESAPLGRRGLSVIYGAPTPGVFRFLWALQPPHPHERPIAFPGDEIQVQAQPTYGRPAERYYVQHVALFPVGSLVRVTPSRHGTLVVLSRTSLGGQVRTVVVVATMGRRPS